MKAATGRLPSTRRDSVGFPLLKAMDRLPNCADFFTP
jgi:hypothetical protein